MDTKVFNVEMLHRSTDSLENISVEHFSKTQQYLEEAAQQVSQIQKEFLVTSRERLLTSPWRKPATSEMESLSI